MSQTVVVLREWSYARRSDGVYVVTGIADTKLWNDKENTVELFTFISPKDMGDHIVIDLPGSYRVKMYKGTKKKDKSNGTAGSS